MQSNPIERMIIFTPNGPLIHRWMKTNATQPPTERVDQLAKDGTSLNEKLFPQFRQSDS
jgi:ribonuclease HI